jgi:hypothetical protein
LPAVVHGGEVVLTPAQQRELFSVRNDNSHPVIVPISLDNMSALIDQRIDLRLKRETNRATTRGRF